MDIMWKWIVYGAMLYFSVLFAMWLIEDKGWKKLKKFVSCFYGVKNG